MKKLLYVLTFVMIFLSCTLIMSVRWLDHTFGLVQLESIIFTLLTPMKGADSILISSFIWNVIALSFIISLCIYLFIYLFIEKRVANSVLCNIKNHILLHCFKYVTLCLIILVLCIFLNLTIKKNFKPSQFYQTSIQNKMPYIIHCNTIEDIEYSINNNYNYVYFLLSSQDLRNAPEIIHQLKTILSNHPKLMLFLPASDQYVQDFQFLLKQLPFPKQLIVECSSLWWYNEAKKNGIFSPILSLDNLPDNHLKQIFHKNIFLLSCSEKLFSNKKYFSIIKELHYRGVTIFLHNFTLNNEHQYSILFDAIFISRTQI